MVDPSMYVPEISDTGKVLTFTATEALKQAEERGVTLIDKVSRKGAEGLNIGFLHPKSTLGVLTELCSKQ